MQTKPKNSVDIVFIAALILLIDLLLLIPDLASNTVRIILAVPLIFLFPGYVLLSIFLKDDRDASSLLFLSLIFSIFIALVVGLIINSLSSNYSQITLNPVYLISTLSIITLIMCIIALFVRKQYAFRIEKKSLSDVINTPKIIQEDKPDYSANETTENK